MDIDPYFGGASHCSTRRRTSACARRPPASCRASTSSPARSVTTTCSHGSAPDDAGVVTPPRYDPALPDAVETRNADAIARYTPRLADRIGAVLDRGEFPVVLGGDCSILLGSLLALRRRGRHGLAYVDGHSDFRHAGNAERCDAAAGEDLAIVTGRGGRLADPDGPATARRRRRRRRARDPRGRRWPAELVAAGIGVTTDAAIRAAGPEVVGARTRRAARRQSATATGCASTPTSSIRAPCRPSTRPNPAGSSPPRSPRSCARCSPARAPSGSRSRSSTPTSTRTAGTPALLAGARRRRAGTRMRAYAESGLLALDLANTLDPFLDAPERVPDVARRSRACSPTSERPDADAGRPRRRPRAARRPARPPRPPAGRGARAGARGARTARPTAASSSPATTAGRSRRSRRPAPGCPIASRSARSRSSSRSPPAASAASAAAPPRRARTPTST